MNSTLLAFSGEDPERFGLVARVSRHRLHELDLFDDDQLVALLDNYPPERLQAFTMGTDPCHREDWRYVDASGVSGKDLFAAVLRGRLWLNLLRVGLADRRYAELLARLTEELAVECPRLGLLSISFGTLLISSPDAMVYYHFDAPHQALWHLRGAKRIWIYPACDERFTPQEIMEDIFVGAYDYDEELPYTPEFDRHAVSFDLKPGEVASWPQNAPHRVANLGTLNVSLSTGFVTEAAERRGLVYAANRFFRRGLGLPLRSTEEHGPGAGLKCFAYRVCRRAGLVPKPAERRAYQATLRVDPDAPLGFRSAAPTTGGSAPDPPLAHGDATTVA